MKLLMFNSYLKCHTNSDIKKKCKEKNLLPKHASLPKQSFITKTESKTKQQKGGAPKILITVETKIDLPLEVVLPSATAVLC